MMILVQNPTMQSFFCFVSGMVFDQFEGIVHYEEVMEFLNSEFVTGQSLQRWAYYNEEENFIQT